MENEPTMDELLEGFGIDPATVESSETDPPDPKTETDPPETDPPEVDPPAEPKPEPEAELPEHDKAQQAFIYLRQQNQSFKNTLKGVAEILGIDPKAGEADMIAALQAKVVEGQAQNANVPVEMLQRLQTLEAKNAEIERSERERVTLLGLQQVKTQFGLEDKDLTKFTQDLIAAGMNPLEADVNLIDTYKSMHFEDLMQKAIADAVAKEQARSAKAASTSSTPDPKRGDPGSGDGKITTQTQLNAWLDTQVKK